jgi:hypothetical protein
MRYPNKKRKKRGGRKEKGKKGKKGKKKRKKEKKRGKDPCVLPQTSICILVPDLECLNKLSFNTPY